MMMMKFIYAPHNHFDDDGNGDDTERMLQITNWDGIALDHLASRDIPQLIEQVCIRGCPTVRTSLGTPSDVRLLAETIVFWKLIKLLMIND